MLSNRLPRSFSSFHLCFQVDVYARTNSFAGRLLYYEQLLYNRTYLSFRENSFVLHPLSLCFIDLSPCCRPRHFRLNGERIKIRRRSCWNNNTPSIRADDRRYRRTVYHHNKAKNGAPALFFNNEEQLRFVKIAHSIDG